MLLKADWFVSEFNIVELPLWTIRRIDGAPVYHHSLVCGKDEIWRLSLKLCCDRVSFHWVLSYTHALGEGKEEGNTKETITVEIFQGGDHRSIQII